MKARTVTILFLFSVLLFTECKKERNAEQAIDKEKNTISITGYFENIGDATKVTIADFTGQLKNSIAMGYTKNKSFMLEVPKKEMTTIYMIDVLGFDGEIPIIVGQDDLIIRVNMETLYLSDVSGDQANDAFTSYKQKKVAFDNQIRSMNDMIKRPNFSADIKTEWEKRLPEFKKRMAEEYVLLFEKNKNNFTAGLIFEDLVREQIINTTEALALFDSLPEVYKNSLGAKTLYQYLSNQ
jgi:hypothetical protein